MTILRATVVREREEASVVKVGGSSRGSSGKQQQDFQSTKRKQPADGTLILSKWPTGHDDDDDHDDATFLCPIRSRTDFNTKPGWRGKKTYCQVRELLVWKAASQGRRAARSSRPSAVAGWEGRRTPCAPAQACREAIWTGETHAEYLARPGAQL
ncbi:uncharacterized protein LOC144463888 [Epinephelus lanceolatus]